MQAAKDRFERWDSYGRRTHPFDPNAPVVNGSYRATQSKRLTGGSPMIVGAEAISSTENTQLSQRGQSTGRVSVDVDDDPPVDHNAVRLKQFLSNSCELSRGKVIAKAPLSAAPSRELPKPAGGLLALYPRDPSLSSITFRATAGSRGLRCSRQCMSL